MVRAVIEPIKILSIKVRKTFGCFTSNIWKQFNSKVDTLLTAGIGRFSGDTFSKSANGS